MASQTSASRKSFQPTLNLVAGQSGLCLSAPDIRLRPRARGLSPLGGRPFLPRTDNASNAITFRYRPKITLSPYLRLNASNAAVTVKCWRTYPHRCHHSFSFFLNTFLSFKPSITFSLCVTAARF